MIIEQLVAEMHDVPGVRVQQRAWLPIRHGTKKREIDVLMTINAVPGFEAQFAFECKNEKHKAGAPAITGFAGKLQEVGIPTQNGVFVSVAGFTDDAIESATFHGIRLRHITEIVRERLADDLFTAIESTVYLLLKVDQLSITSDEPELERANDHALVFYDESGRAVGTVPDLIWMGWVSGSISDELGPSKLKLALPDSWRRTHRGKVVTIEEVTADVRVIGEIVKRRGNLQAFDLLVPHTSEVDRRYTRVQFERPAPGASLVLPVVTADSEEELQERLKGTEGLRVTIGRFRLPRIRIGHMYWPLSERVVQVMRETYRDYREGRISSFGPDLFAGIEGTDIRTIFEPPYRPTDG